MQSIHCNHIVKKLFYILLLTPVLTSCEYDYIRQNNNPYDTANIISFSKDLQPLFDYHCLICHRYTTPILTTGNSYRELMNAAPEICDSFSSFINKATPEQSLLYIKFLNNPPCGIRMPPCKQWPQDYIDKVLLWIKQGALNN